MTTQQHLMAICGFVLLVAALIVGITNDVESKDVENTTSEVENTSQGDAVKSTSQSDAVENTSEYKAIRKYFSGEFETIINAAKRNDCTGDLFYILLAIRKAESGRKGLEFGVLHPKARNTNLDTQSGWAAATVVKNYKRWKDAGSVGCFIVFLGNRYCPVGADNDPNGLNKNWVRNVKTWYFRLKKENI